MSGQTLEESLPALPLHMQTDTALTQHLAARFYARLPTATLNSQALITFNTNTSATDGHNGSEEGSAAAATKDLASRMWARLGYRQENQAVLFLYGNAESEVYLRRMLTQAAGANRVQERPHFDHTCCPLYYRSRRHRSPTSSPSPPTSSTR
jgi:chitin synthase